MMKRPNPNVSFGANILEPDELQTRRTSDVLNDIANETTSNTHRADPGINVPIDPRSR